MMYKVKLHSVVGVMMYKVKLHPVLQIQFSQQLKLINQVNMLIDYTTL